MNGTNCKATLIIRSVGERTESLCRALILAQGIPEVNVFIVHEAPFSAAMRKSFEIGLEQGRPWTLCVDADVLFRPGAVEQMVTLAGQQEANICEIQGYILDKFFGGPRHGGVHLYRTALLPQVIASIPAEGVDVRPEYHTLKAMAQAGFPWAVVPYLVGLHDFEQYYRDIFRKCFVHARKHQYLMDLFLVYWREMAQLDRDYVVALQGLGKGVAFLGEVLIDVQQDIYREAFGALAIEDKPPLSADAYSLDAIESIITNWKKPEPYCKHYPTEMGLLPPLVIEPGSWRQRLTQRLQKTGVVRTGLYGAGWALSRIGKSLQTRAERGKG